MVGILLIGPSPLRLMSKMLIKLSEPAKKWFGLSDENSRECGAMYSSVVADTRGYVASIEGVNGDSRRMGRARSEVRKRAVERDCKTYKGWMAVA